MAADLKLPFQDDRRFLGQPLGLATLFTTELWERFSFYGMRALLVLYMVAPESKGGLGIDAVHAAGIYGVYVGMVWLLTLPGGWAGDRLWGQRRATIVGAVVIAVGHLSMAVPVSYGIWGALVLVAIGSGLLKPNISAMVGGLYDTDSDEGERRTSGFMLFYMGINVGAFIGPVICGYLANMEWRYGFAAAGFGMGFAVLCFLLFAPRTLGDVGVEVANPAPAEVKRRLLTGSLIITFVVAAVIALLLITGTFEADYVITSLVIVTVVAPVVFFVKIFRTPTLTLLERNQPLGSSVEGFS